MQTFHYELVGTLSRASWEELESLLSPFLGRGFLRGAGFFSVFLAAFGFLLRGFLLRGLFLARPFLGRFFLRLRLAFGPTFFLW